MNAYYSSKTKAEALHGLRQFAKVQIHNHQDLGLLILTECQSQPRQAGHKFPAPFLQGLWFSVSIVPAFTSISSCRRLYISVLVAILIQGAGFEPNADPRPVVKATRLQPLAI